MEDKENNDHWKTIQKINEKLQQKYVEYQILIAKAKVFSSILNHLGRKWFSQKTIKTKGTATIKQRNKRISKRTSQS